MKAPSPVFAAAFGLGFALALPVAAAAPDTHADTHVPAKPDRGERSGAPVRAAMRATLQADGTLKYECLTVPHPKYSTEAGATAATEPTPQQMREER